jgi:probable F420-dependent oxidoreductase
VIFLTKFGVHLGGPIWDPRQFGELCRNIEDLGFDSVWLADGLTRGIPEPFPMLACGSAFTNRVKLGTCIYVVPVRHPLQTAKLSATLDRLSKGRLILGVGVGWREDEFKAVGMPFSKRGLVADECLQILRQAWVNGEVNFQGEFFNIGSVKMDLKPEQKPHPPIWVGGNGRTAALRAARFGEYWIPTDYTVDEYRHGATLLADACKKANRDSNDIKMASHLMVLLGRSESEADEQAKELTNSLHEKPEDFKNWAIVGDSREAARRLEEYNVVGVSYHVLNFATKIRGEERIEEFAREILPSFN